MCRSNKKIKGMYICSPHAINVMFSKLIKDWALDDYFVNKLRFYILNSAKRTKAGLCVESG